MVLGTFFSLRTNDIFYRTLRMERLLTLVRAGVEIPLLCFHISVVVCVIRQVRKKNPMFTTAFFAIYIVQSMADVGTYVMVSVKILKKLFSC